MTNPKKAGRPPGQFQRKADKLYEYLCQNQKNGHIHLTDNELGEIFRCSSKQISRYLHLLKSQQKLSWTILRFPLNQKSWFTRRYIYFGPESQESEANVNELREGEVGQ
jgi:hypothetical protein